jgi:hypothetical protein
MGAVQEMVMPATLTLVEVELEETQPGALAVQVSSS